MPWTVKDVDRHKKGLTSTQKKSWVKTANKVLADCKAKKGKDCEGKAIRIANSKFSQEMKMTKEIQKIPEAALQLVQHDCFAQVTGDEKPKLEMTIYSGKVIPNHFWWGDLAIDLDGMEFNKNKSPILESHDTSKKIAFNKGKPVIEDYQLKFSPDKVEFVDTSEAAEFIKLSKEGFPYESSFYGIPSVVESVEAGASVQVNGFTLKGPASVWRKWVFKEASVCVFGYDSNTKSSAFAKEIEITVDVNNPMKKTEEVKTKMNLTEFKAEHTDVYTELVTEVTGVVTQELETKFAGEKEEMETKFADEKKTLEDAHSKENEDTTKRVLELEKSDSIRRENDLKLSASNIWTAKLNASDIPERLFAKVAVQVDYSKYVKDDILDKEKFTEAIDAEITDWEARGITSKVLGMGTTVKDAETTSSNKEAEKEVEDNVDLLCSFVGLKKENA